MPILIFSPVQIIMRHPLQHLMSMIVVKLFCLRLFSMQHFNDIFLQFYSQKTLGVRGQPRQYKRGWSHCFASGKLLLMYIVINRYNNFQLIFDY